MKIIGCNVKASDVDENNNFGYDVSINGDGNLYSKAYDQENYNFLIYMINIQCN